jgi:hypothetical protein
MRKLVFVFLFSLILHFHKRILLIKLQQLTETKLLLQNTPFTKLALILNINYQPGHFIL